MPQRLTHLRLFIASPGDLEEERLAVVRAVERLNSELAAHRGVAIDTMQWPTEISPGIGTEPQEVINRQIRYCDIFVFMFWKRLGTPTGHNPSGTVEEFEQAYSRWQKDHRPEILVYFSEREFFPHKHDLDELGRLFSFRSELEKRGVLYHTFNNIVTLERQIGHDVGTFVQAYDTADEQPRSSLLDSLGGSRQFHGTLMELVERRQQVGLVYVDFDMFTKFNDQFGKTKSNEILEIATERMLAIVGHRGHLFRYSGDEFAILISNRSATEIVDLAERVRVAIEHVEGPIPSGGPGITASLGVACTPAVPGTELFIRAYEATYLAKLTGKNRVAVCPLSPENQKVLADAHARGFS